MKRPALDESLRTARLRVALGEEHLSRQRRVILDLESATGDFDRARDLLQTLEATQQMFIAHLELLQRASQAGAETGPQDALSARPAGDA